MSQTRAHASNVESAVTNGWRCLPAAVVASAPGARVAFAEEASIRLQVSVQTILWQTEDVMLRFR
jgi:hypothetical protein